MILTSAPLRFSLIGGGSDLPAFTNSSTGRVLSCSINKRVYVTLNKNFSGRYRIAYSKLEDVGSIDEINHILVKSCLEKVNWSGPGLEITSVADVPSNGTGLGSSSAFTVALLLGLNRLNGVKISKYDLAIQACEVEIELAKSPIGRQDQFASTVGGLNEFVFHKSQVEINRVRQVYAWSSRKLINNLNQHLLFFHFNSTRNANEILSRQSELITQDLTYHNMTSELAQLALDAKRFLKRSDFQSLGRIMTEGWAIKCRLNGDLENGEICEILNFANESCVYGAKLLGAGGGGFVAILAHPKHHDFIKSSLKQKYPLTDIQVEGTSAVIHKI